VDRVPTLGIGGYSGWVRLADVYDGDTITVVAPLGCETYKIRVRLSGVDAPELRGINKNAGIVARDALIAHLTGIDMTNVGSTMVRHILRTNAVLVWIVCSGHDKYGRALCDVYNEAHAIAGRLASSSDFLIGAGYAVPYDGGSRQMPLEKSTITIRWM